MKWWYDMAEENDGWAMILGGLIGAGLAAPKPEDKQELQEYRNLKQQLSLRQQRLGSLPSMEKLRSKPQAYNLFIESYNMYLYGFFRGSSILCSALIEFLLKEKYGNRKFYDLINEAEKNKIITTAETHYLHGLRLERNDFVHDILREVKEEDSNLILKITINLLNKLLNR